MLHRLWWHLFSFVRSAEGEHINAAVVSCMGRINSADLGCIGRI